MRFRYAALLLALLAIASTAYASTLYVGYDTRSPVQRYTTTGTFLGNFGQGGATGSAIGGGNVWTVAPAFGNNTIVRYDAAGNPLATFTATVNGDWIEDMTYGGANTLWVSGVSSRVYRIDATTGAVLSSFTTPSDFVFGVTSDGTNLWVTDGFSGDDSIYRYDTNGTLLATIHTGFTTSGGIGFDAATGTLWVGYFDVVRQFNLSGTLLSTLNLPGGFHDGLEVSSPVPEPASLLLLGSGLLGFARRLRKKA